MFDLIKRKNVFLLFAAFSVPLTPENWEMLKFSKMKPNTFSSNNNGLTINVRESSSPLIQKFDKSFSFTRVVAKGEIINGKINLKNDQIQGLFKKKSITDDYAFRLGLVLDGDRKRPNFFSWFLLPSWVKKLYRIVPKQMGVDRVYFLNVVHNKTGLGKKRHHPLHKVLYEEGVTQAKSGKFIIDKTFDKPMVIHGLWLSSNGEGTKSQFDTVIKSIEFY